MSTAEEIAADLKRPLNRKDITAEITGQAFDFDDEGNIAGPQNPAGPQQPTTPAQMHPLVGVMDMVINTSPTILKKYGYPSPETAIWNEWGKQNFNEAFHQYFPMTGGDGKAIPQPLIALSVGFMAIVLTFLPVILHWREEREKQAAIERAKEEPEPEAEPQGYQKAAAPIPEPQEPIEATTPVQPAQINTPMMDLIAKNLETTEAQPI